MESDKFDWLKNMDTKNYGLKEKELNYDILKGDRSYELDRKKLDHTIFKDNRDDGLSVARLNAELTEQGRKRIKEEADAATKAKAESEQDTIGIAAMRKKFPNATKGLTDDEIKFFVKLRSVGDMHLTIFACNRAIFLDNHRRIVVQACHTTLEKRQHQYHPKLTSDSPKILCTLTGDRFGLIENGDLLCLAKVKPVVQLL